MKLSLTAFATRLMKLRCERHVSQKVLADYLNISRPQISKYENGDDEASYDTLLRIAHFFEVDPNYLLGWDGETTGILSESEFLEILTAYGKEIYKELNRKGHN